MTPETAKRFNLAGAAITVFTVFCAILWAFPIYWSVISSLKPDDEVVRSYFGGDE